LPRVGRPSDSSTIRRCGAGLAAVRLEPLGRREVARYHLELKRDGRPVVYSLTHVLSDAEMLGEERVGVIGAENFAASCAAGRNWWIEGAGKVILF